MPPLGAFCVDSPFGPFRIAIGRPDNVLARAGARILKALYFFLCDRMSSYMTQETLEERRTVRESLLTGPGIALERKQDKVQDGGGVVPCNGRC